LKYMECACLLEREGVGFWTMFLKVLFKRCNPELTVSQVKMKDLVYGLREAVSVRKE